MTDFFNPYAFVPAPARTDDGEPFEPGGRLRPDRWTGVLRVKMTAVTPILITDQKPDGEGIVRETRVIDSQVVVPSTSVKGMVRSEFEMVTNSRFGVFHEHEARLGYRESTDDAKGLVPVRVVGQDGDRRSVVLLHGWTPEDQPDKVPMLKAAWVPRYGDNPITTPVAHGAEVWAWVVLVERSKLDRWGKARKLRYWRALALFTGDDEPGLETAPDVAVLTELRESGGTHRVVDGSPAELIRGWYFHSNQNIKDKHDERIFFDRDQHVGYQPDPVWIDSPVVKGWEDLIESYHAAHKPEDIHARRENGVEFDADKYIPMGRDPDKPAWSWHLTVKDGELDTLKSLPPETLCYARMRGDKVVELLPVALSRRLYDKSPQALAGISRLTPAATHQQLSIADRVFGWVPPAGREDRKRETKAIRGRVRFGPVSAVDAGPEDRNRGLAVLERPRPTQDLFYAAENPAAEPLGSSPGYKEGQGLRGRKVYPHQPIDGEQRFLHGTGRTTDDKPDFGKQNALLKNWIPAGAKFEFDLNVEDLTDNELGALLYVLRGADGKGTDKRFHKLGGGKPLGLGTVTIDVVPTDLRTGTAWRDYFALSDDAPTGNQLNDAAMDRLARNAVQGTTTHVRAYNAYLEGFPDDTPVRYPADPRNPTSDEERYKWFVANRRRRPSYSLGELASGYVALKLPENPNGGGR